MFKTPQSDAPQGDPRTTTPLPPGMPAGGGESDMHLLDRLSVVYRYRRLVISIVLLILVGSIVQTFTTVRRYKATATV